MQAYNKNNHLTPVCIISYKNIFVIQVNIVYNRIMSNYKNQSPIDSRSAGIRNELLVLNVLRTHGQMSQSGLCRQADLSSSTVSYIIGRLREKNLIIEEQGKSVSRGAKPILISINPTGRFVLGIEINPTDIFAGLFNFNCKLVENIRTSITAEQSVSEIVRLIEITARGLLSKHNITEKMVAGIGLTVSGSISKNGVVELSSPMGWKTVPLRAMLQERFDCPISVHATRVRLLAERIIDPTLTSQNVLYINVASGVGGHIISDGHLSHGVDNRSGEIGHIVIDANGPLCGCEHKGCLEAYISGPALTAKIRNDLTTADSQLASMITESDLPADVLAKLGLAIKNNDAYALKVQQYIADKLAPIAAIAINCYDPQVVILAGYVCMQCFDHLAEAIRHHIETDVFDNLSRQISIIPAKAGDKALIIGTASAILREFTQPA
jgi:predicted NBD/HSP70 family sugar kinase